MYNSFESQRILRKEIKLEDVPLCRRTDVIFRIAVQNDLNNVLNTYKIKRFGRNQSMQILNYYGLFLCKTDQNFFMKLHLYKM